MAARAYNFVARRSASSPGTRGCNLALEAIAAAAARGWTSYARRRFTPPQTRSRYEWDPAAAMARAARGAGPSSRGGAARARRRLCSRTARRSRRFRASVTAVSLLVIFFVITLGGLSVEKENWTPFAPGGVEGVLAGASVVFFSFVGFDDRRDVRGGDAGTRGGTCPSGSWARSASAPSCTRRWPW